MTSVEAVARENGEVISALAPSGCAVFPAEDVCAPIWLELAGSRPHLSFALKGETDVTGQARWRGDCWALELHPAGTAPVQLHMAGEHNLQCAGRHRLRFGRWGAADPIHRHRRGLEAFRAVKAAARSAARRARPPLDRRHLQRQPDSVRAAIDVLAACPRRNG